MNSTRTLQRAVIGALTLAAVGAVEAQNVEESKEELQEIVVTGRRPFTTGNMDIVRTENDAQPYHIVQSEEIERSGAANVESFLKKHLTMNTVAVSNVQSAARFRASQSQINLRGVGTNQTLILINGRRTANVVLLGGQNQPDVNGIPMSAIERIEVLPVSSAAIYGGSAIGGVVNVVLKRNYEGGNVNLTYRNTFDANAPIRTADASYGFDFEDGKTNLVVGGRYSDTPYPLLSKDRPQLYSRGLNRVLQNNPSLLTSPTAPYIGGSTPNIGSLDGSNLVLRPEYGGTALGSNITHVPVGTTPATAPGVVGAGLVANAGTYNYDMANTVSDDSIGLAVPVMGSPETKSFISSLRRRMSDNVEVFGEFYDSTSRIDNKSSPSSRDYVISASSPVNPFQQAVRIAIPGSNDDVTITSENEIRRFTAGVVVDLPHDWQAESDYTWTRNKNGYGSVLTDTGSGGLPAGFASGEVNPFVDGLASGAPFGLDADGLARYWGVFGSSQTSTLNNLAVRIAGPLWHMPAGYPTLAVGIERRTESMKGDGVFFREFPNGPASSNLTRRYVPKSQTILSGYAEMKLPLVSAAQSVPAVQELELQLSARTERFKVTTGTSFVTVGVPTTIITEEVDYSSTNPTLGLRYKPFDSVMLRASYATGFLPPDYVQFLAPTPGGVDILGPLARINVIDPQRGNQVTSVAYLAGGNPNIEPQNSESWSLGIVFEPQGFLSGLRANLEWYRLTQKDAAVTPTAQQVVTLDLPGRVTRATPAPGDPFAVGEITHVDFSLLSANRAETEGFDLSLSYRRALGDFGTMQLAVAGTTVRSFKQQTTIGGSLTDIVGEVANGGPLEHKGNLVATWMRGGWKADWILSYYGSYEQFDVGGITSYTLAQGGTKIPSQSYSDVVVQYTWPDDLGGSSWQQSMLSGTTVQLGIGNVFNKTPPFDAFYESAHYYSPFGNPRLREYWLSISKSF